MLRNILVPLDGSALSELALRYAIELARTTEGRLVLVRTAHPHHRTHLVRHYEAPQDAADYLHEHAERLRSSGVRVDTAVPAGEPPEALLAEIERRQPDLVVMATHGRSGLGRWVYGSITEAVIARAMRPVMLVRAWATASEVDGPRLRGKTVLVPLDGWEFGETALPVAARLARALDGELMLLEPASVMALPYMASSGQPIEVLDPVVWDPLVAQEQAQAHIERMASRLRERDRHLRVSGVARLGDVADLIRELAASRAREGQSIGLIVMATHGRQGLGRAILGEDADTVLRKDDLPLVLVHPSAGQLHVDNVLAAAAGEA